jgi:hypothetical protein
MAVSWVFLILILFASLVGGVVAFAVAFRDRGNRAERHQSPGYEGQRPRSVFGLILGIFLALAVGSVVLVVVWGSFRTRSHHVQEATLRAEAPRALVLPDPLPATAQPPRALERGSNLVAGEVVSSELWNRFTESRITLDAESAEKPANDSSTEDEEPKAESESEPAPRPDWVDEPPKLFDVDEVQRVVVASDSWSTEDECRVQLEQRFLEEVKRRLAKQLVPSDQSSLVEHGSIEATGITLDYIMGNIYQGYFVEIVESSVGAMRKVYVLMEFTTDVDKHLLQSWQGQLRRHRLTSVSLIAGGILAVLATLYGMLQFDTWTRGYYTKRLLWGVPAAIIAVATVAVLFVA